MSAANERAAASLMGTSIGASDSDILDQQSFLRRLSLEQRRTERSRNRFVLMLLDSACLSRTGIGDETLGSVLAALIRLTRETDVKYTDGSVIGIIFTEIGSTDGRSVANALLNKVSTALSSALSIEQIHQISLSFHVFPDDWQGHGSGRPWYSAAYQKSVADSLLKRASLVIKRAMDIVGSLCALTILSPLLLAIAILIKLTSNGPVLFRQQRTGQYGHQFTFLKFRSMVPKNDQTLHEEYVRTLISSKSSGERQPGEQKVAYKMTHDPRITSIGKFLRRTSLDELPQFFNVLKGDMSLVGPRPPIPYEIKYYDIWHKRRLREVKPGITGLWQVTGRSRVGFDEMVRLDLKYARSWSLWLDIKIILKTPRAVLGGDGAY